MLLSGGEITNHLPYYQLLPGSALTPVCLSRKGLGKTPHSPPAASGDDYDKTAGH